MHTHRLRKIIGLLLAILLLLGIAILSSTSVAAQSRPQPQVRFLGPPIHPVPPLRRGFGRPFGPYDRYGYYSEYVFSNSESAANQGYHDGVKTGSGDAQHNRSYDPERSHYFHDAGFGNFAEAYRTGFSRGYKEGYRSNREG